MKAPLERILRKNENSPEDSQTLGKKYFVQHAMVGSSGLFVSLEGDNYNIHTSTVSDVGVHENNFIVKTKNSTYYFNILV